MQIEALEEPQQGRAHRLKAGGAVDLSGHGRPDTRQLLQELRLYVGDAQALLGGGELLLEPFDLGIGVLTFRL